MPRIAQHESESTKKVAAFVKNLNNAVTGNGATLDSVDEFASQALSQSDHLPETLAVLLDEVNGQNIKLDGVTVSHRSVILQSILDGVGEYTSEHGCAPSTDLIEAALYQGFSTSQEACKKLAKFDSVSASSSNMDPISMQPNRAVVAISRSLAEAIPIGSYLPFDIGSNESPLIIVQNIAGLDSGSMRAGDLLDGLNAGKAYMSTSRFIKLVGGKGKVTATMTDDETCDPAGPAVKLLRGRTKIYVEGLIAGKETIDTAATTSMIGGSIRFGSTDYAVSGTVKPDTGEIDIAFTPSLPSNMVVHAQAYIDLEKMPNLTPIFGVQALKYSMKANAWRGLVQVSIDANTQFTNEIGMTPETHSLLAMRNQMANERHYEVLNVAALMGRSNVGEYKFDWSTQGLQKSRNQIAQDIMAAIFPLEQKMANDTMDHGITHMYVDEVMASTLLCCDSTVFQPSGVAPRPSIYRLGRLLGKYDVYLNPRARKPNAVPGVSKILCVGRSTQAGRNPFVLGDAVAPMAVPVATGSDMVNKSGLYGRNFTSVNPHAPSAKGCAILTVTGLTS